VYQPEGKYSQPTKCLADCKNHRNFVPLRSSRNTIYADRQVIRLQEVLQPGDATESGRVPRTVDCELTEDLCDSTVPGDIIWVTGVVKVVSGEEARTS
jgi:DNA helicase MCM8